MTASGLTVTASGAVWIEEDAGQVAGPDHRALHPPRDDFMAIMNTAESSAFEAHAAWLRRMLAQGVLIVAEPRLGQVNTGIAISEASDEQAARHAIAGQPVTRRRVHAE